ncbi:hypothetical protein [Pseudomonas sp. NBRC 111133]|uniref:hypothetical protein n=1 Tax=Pseudomonas sp. NBRC 111133 TaxID=1661048 RepID=UPI000761DA0B|nr:hypothetical protein [Pseudomonas sp. NBRC 111133]
MNRILVHEGQAVSRDSPLVTLDDAVPRANLELAQANLAIARDQYAKRLAAYGIDARSISKDALDTAKNQAAQAQAAFKAAAAELARYVIKAPSDGIVVSINSAVGSYVSPQGAYSIHTQGFNPLLVMTSVQDRLVVRCYVDEILIEKLPPFELMQLAGHPCQPDRSAGPEPRVRAWRRPAMGLVDTVSLASPGCFGNASHCPQPEPAGG